MNGIPNPKAHASSISSDKVLTHRNLVLEWTEQQWAEVTTQIHRACVRKLRRYPWIEPWDVCQDILTQLLRRDFGQKFDPRRASLWVFILGVITNECCRAIQRATRDGRLPPSVVRVQTSTELDPAEAAELKENRHLLREALHRATKQLTSAERTALPRITHRANHTRNSARLSNSTPYSQDCRCRRKLRSLLADFAGH